MKAKLKAFLDTDLEGLLDRLGLTSDFKRGRIKCKFCRTVLTFQNLYSLFPEGGDIKGVCDASECVDDLYRHLEELKYE